MRTDTNVWLQADCEKLKELYEKGVMVREIPQFMGRTYQSIATKLKRLRRSGFIQHQREIKRKSKIVCIGDNKSRKTIHLAILNLINDEFKRYGAIPESKVVCKKIKEIMPHLSNNTCKIYTWVHLKKFRESIGIQRVDVLQSEQQKPKQTYKTNPQIMTYINDYVKEKGHKPTLKKLAKKIKHIMPHLKRSSTEVYAGQYLKAFREQQSITEQESPVSINETVKKMGKPYKITKDVIEQIKALYKQNKSLEDIAETCNISKTSVWNTLVKLKEDQRGKRSFEPVSTPTHTASFSSSPLEVIPRIVEQGQLKNILIKTNNEQISLDIPHRKIMNIITDMAELTTIINDFEEHIGFFNIKTQCEQQEQQIKEISKSHKELEQRYNAQMASNTKLIEEVKDLAHTKVELQLWCSNLRKCDAELEGRITTQEDQITTQNKIIKGLEEENAQLKIKVQNEVVDKWRPQRIKANAFFALETKVRELQTELEQFKKPKLEEKVGEATT